MFDDGGSWTVAPGARQPEGAALAIAVPGILSGHRVAAASNLGWFDVDPVDALGLTGPALVVTNDAAAAALGESALRRDDRLPDLVFVGLGTGVGGAVVVDGAVSADNLFGHGGEPFGDASCRCGRRGCLETIAGGWAAPEPLDADGAAHIGAAVAAAVEHTAVATPRLVVVAGGMARRHPGIVEAVARNLPGRIVEASAAPDGVKSAAAWGLAHLCSGERSRL